MAAACLAGLHYYAAVFAFAFAMGVARTLVITPQLGATAAVLLEIPIVLALSWFVARSLLLRRDFTLPQCTVMGATAFILTMLSEVALSALMRGQGISEWLASLMTPLGLVGLAGQLAFAIMPVLTGIKRSDPASKA
jgi:hypothetical protein